MWDYNKVVLHGCVGACVTLVAAGVHSLILILTASMTYVRVSVPNSVCYLVEKKVFFSLYVTGFKLIRNGNRFFGRMSQGMEFKSYLVGYSYFLLYARIILTDSFMSPSYLCSTINEYFIIITTNI